MYYQDPVRLEMKTVLHDKPGIRVLETHGKLTPFGDLVRFDLSLQNKDLSNHRFTIKAGCNIFHASGAYECVEDACKVGRPHHLVVHTKLIA